MLEKIPARELLTNIAGGLKPLFEEKHVKLKISAQPAYIMVEYDLFKTLLLNLIDNAIKAGCGWIEIAGRQTGGSYSLSVSDNGRGMSAAELARITEAFYVADKSRSCKDIIHHYNRKRIESQPIF